MKSEKLQVKVFAASAPRLDPHRLVPVFHRWVKERVLEGELLIDVADYTHVEHGPSILLVGHGSDLYWDEDAGRAGLLFSRKRGGPGAEAARLPDAVRRALDACRRLEEEPSLAGLSFEASELLVRVNDRRVVPGDATEVEAAAAEVRALAGRLFPDAPPTVERVGEPREPLAFAVRGPGGTRIADLLARV